MEEHRNYTSDEFEAKLGRIERGWRLQEYNGHQPFQLVEIAYPDPKVDRVFATLGLSGLRVSTSNTNQTVNTELIIGLTQKHAGQWVLQMLERLAKSVIGGEDPVGPGWVSRTFEPLPTAPWFDRFYLSELRSVSPSTGEEVTRINDVSILSVMPISEYEHEFIAQSGSIEFDRSLASLRAHPWDLDRARILRDMSRP